MRIKYDPWQEEFLKTEGDKILCCGRQVGKSEICAKDASDYAVKNPNKTILMIAPTERQAYELFNKTLSYLMSYYLRSIKMGKDRPTKTKIVLNNKTRILCLPTGVSGVGIRGLTISRIYVDEASRVPEDVWGAVQPMLLTTGGNMILLSTPAGAEGEFYRVWTNKDSAYSSFTRFSVNTEDVVRDREICSSWTEIQKEKALNIIEQAKARMSNQLFAQEYLGEFVDSLHRYFPDELIKEICTLKLEGYNPGRGEYYLGVDVARMGEDESSFEILLKLRDGKIIHTFSQVTRKTLTTETEKRIIALNSRYNFRKIAIDAGSGSLGVGIYDHLLEYPEVRRKLEAINNAKRVYDTEKKNKGRLLKEDLYDNLRGLMQRREITLLNDTKVIESLRSVMYEYVTRDGEPTRIRIYGDYTHIVEGLIRAAWYAKGKPLNIWISSLRV